MKTSVRRTILFLSFIVTMSSLMAQNNIYSIELLKKEWMPIGIENKDFSSTCKFDNENMISNFQYEGVDYPLQDTYYLSNTPESKFDDNKVGKIKSGKYIIQKSKSGVIVFEIIELTKDSLQLKNLLSELTVKYTVKQ
ncbi:MAG: hypothetical protein LUH22_12590 [Bacteroides sp.]|nr:hypothetical protein [Bacteroides sp.]